VPAIKKAAEAAFKLTVPVLITVRYFPGDSGRLSLTSTKAKISEWIGWEVTR
jgi:hypothetical protein